MLLRYIPSSRRRTEGSSDFAFASLDELSPGCRQSFYGVKACVPGLDENIWVPVVRTLNGKFAFALESTQPSSADSLFEQGL